jgi:hypothetical protein
VRRSSLVTECGLRGKKCAANELVLARGDNNSGHTWQETLRPEEWACAWRTQNAESSGDSVVVAPVDERERDQRDEGLPKDAHDKRTPALA